MRTSFAISLKRSTLILQLSTSRQADYPIFWECCGHRPTLGPDRFRRGDPIFRRMAINIIYRFHQNNDIAR